MAFVVKETAARVTVATVLAEGNCVCSSVMKLAKKEA